MLKDDSTEKKEARITFKKGPVLFLAIASLSILIVAAYINTFRVPFLLDDSDSIEKNPTIRSLASSFAPPSKSGITVSGRPLLNTTLAINYALGGVDVVGYHVGNLLIHVLASIMLFGVVRRTLLLPSLGNRYGKQATALAWFAAACWGLHPMQTESVTYIIQRAESLVGLFYIATFYTFIRSIEAPQAGWKIATVVLCAFGMMAKEVMTTAPLVIFLYDRTFVTGSFAQSWEQRWKFYLTLAATWIILLVLIISSGGRGTTVGFSHVTAKDYLLTQAPGICGYLWHSIWPLNLVFDYGAIVEKTPSVLIPAAMGLFIMLALAFYTVVKRPMAGFLAAWVFIILAPTSSFVPIATQTLAEHRMYLPLVALAVTTVILLQHFLPRSLLGAGLAAIVLVEGVLTYNRNQDYLSSKKIWEDTAQKVPDNARAHTNLGYVYFQEGNLEKALSCYSESAQLIPDAWTYNQLGLVLLKLGRHSDALAVLSRAAALRPDNAKSQVLIGEAFIALNRTAEGIVALREAIRLQSNDPEAHLDLANVLAKEEHFEEAARHFAYALELSPGNPEALVDYAILLRTMQRFPEAIQKLQSAILLDPKLARAHSNLGVTLLQSDRTEEGVRQLEETLTLNPADQQALYNLATYYSEVGKTDPAIRYFETLTHIASPNAEIFNNLGVLYAQTGRLDEAIRALEKALQIDPNHQASKENLEKIRDYTRSASQH